MERLQLATAAVHTALSRMLKEDCQMAGSVARIIWAEPTTSTTTLDKPLGSGRAQDSTRLISAEM
jgi:hypothetical protein